MSNNISIPTQAKMQSLLNNIIIEEEKFPLLIWNNLKRFNNYINDGGVTMINNNVVTTLLSDFKFRLPSNLSFPNIEAIGRDPQLGGSFLTFLQNNVGWGEWSKLYKALNRVVIYLSLFEAIFPSLRLSATSNMGVWRDVYLNAVEWSKAIRDKIAVTAIDSEKVIGDLKTHWEDRISDTMPFPFPVDFGLDSNCKITLPANVVISDPLHLGRGNDDIISERYILIEIDYINCGIGSLGSKPIRRKRAGAPKHFFDDCIIGRYAKKITRIKHIIIEEMKGRRGKVAVMVIQAMIDNGYIRKPTYAEFKELMTTPNITEYNYRQYITYGGIKNDSIYNSEKSDLMLKLKI